MLRFGALAFTLGLSATLAVVAVPRAAFAADDLGFSGCNAKPTKTDTADAKRSYERGKRLFDERDRGAIDLFRSAYLADCTKHELLVVLSFAYQSDGQLKEALAASELYLQKRGGSLAAEDRHTVEERIALLKQKRKEQEEAAAAAAAPKPAPGPAQPPIAPPRAEAPAHRSPLPWVVVGVGAAAVVTGAILFPVGNAMIPSTCGGSPLFSSNKSSTCTRTGTQEQAEADAEKAGRGKGMRLGGFITMVAGGAAVVGGLVWFAIDATSSSGTTTGRRRIVPLLSPTSVGLAGTF